MYLIAGVPGGDWFIQAASWGWEAAFSRVPEYVHEEGDPWTPILSQPLILVCNKACEDFV